MFYLIYLHRYTDFTLCAFQPHLFLFARFLILPAYFYIIFNVFVDIFIHGFFTFIMNELDSLRQEAETLKNTIRVSSYFCFYFENIFYLII